MLKYGARTRSRMLLAAPTVRSGRDDVHADLARQEHMLCITHHTDILRVGAWSPGVDEGTGEVCRPRRIADPQCGVKLKPFGTLKAYQDSNQSKRAPHALRTRAAATPKAKQGKRQVGQLQLRTTLGSIAICGAISVMMRARGVHGTCMATQSVHHSSPGQAPS